ncbi:MAG: HAMP domain-containing protein [Gemmatimonadetes bacterium]|nr:HAMP domain-containing protein [Gemmatimonadota bacterium]
MSYLSRLIAATALVLLVAIAVLVFEVGRSVRRDVEEQTVAGLERNANLVRLALPADSSGWQAAVTAASEATGLRVTIVGADGRVRAESDLGTAAELDRIENHGSRPEIAAALIGQVGRNHRTSATIGTGYWYLAIPGGPDRTVVRVAMPDATVDTVVTRARRPVYLGAVLALTLGILIAGFAARRITRPLAQIGEAAQAIARGEPPSLPYSTIPDIERLSNNLRAMQEQLAARFAALQAQQVQSSAIVDSMVEGVLAADSRGAIMAANPAARRMLGYESGESLPELRLVFRGKEARDAVDRALRSGESVTDREVSLGDRTYLLNIRPLAGGGTVVVLHDLTHLKRLEAVRRDFVANASHELKTPLTAISGYAETLLSETPEPAVARQFLETILANARRMQRLVDDQLDLSRIESGRWLPAPERVAVTPIAQEAWALAAPARGEAPTLVMDVTPAAMFLAADLDAVRQVLRNLFENAIRHTAPDGRVTVSARPDGEFVRLSVTDTGTGIPSDHVPRIFERFYRVDPSRARAEGGTGLGLAIVKHLVEAHGGRVAAQSEVGRGTTIHCWIPPDRSNPG